MAKSAGFLDAVRAESQHPGPRCGVKKLLESGIDPVLAGEIVEALDDKTLAHTAILRALQARDDLPVKVARHALEAHRRGQCSCGVR